MRISIIILFICLQILACKKPAKHTNDSTPAIDTIALVANSIRLRSELDTIIKKNNYLGSIACGETVSHEVIRDSSDTKLKSTLYIYIKNSLSEARIISYYSNDQIVFTKIEYREDLREDPKFEQNIYTNDQTKVKEQILGRDDDLPLEMRQNIKAFSNKVEIKNIL